MCRSNRFDSSFWGVGKNLSLLLLHLFLLHCESSSDGGDLHSIVLMISLFQDNKADVILKYNAEEARSLKAYGELPEHGELNMDAATAGSKNDGTSLFGVAQNILRSLCLNSCLYSHSQNQRGRGLRTGRRRRDPVRRLWRR